MGNAPQEDLNAVVALYSRGRLDDAMARAIDVVARHPGCEIAHNIAGAVAGAARRHEEAVNFYDRAVALAPDYVEAFNNRGNALKELGRHQAALASFDAAIALAPDYAEAHLNRAIVLRLEKRFDEAIAANGAAIRCNPGLLQAYSNRGNIFQELYRFHDALADYDRALQLDPGFAIAHVNRGNVLRNLDRPEDAVGSYDRAIALAPGLAIAHRNRGSVLKELKRLDEALASFEQALALDPADTIALSEAAMLRAQMCCWGAPDRAGELVARVRKGEGAPPFHLLAFADDAALQLANARVWADRHFPRKGTAPAVLRAAGDRIRIGYFSADFHQHATMALMIGMLERHDRSRFEIHAFSYGPDAGDAMRRRVAAAVDMFHDVRNLGDEAAARLARDQGIDVAVDLKGYTEHTRLGIFAWGAAPCQVAFLGYPGTSGTDYIDHFVADQVTVPQASAAWFSEAVLRLPRCYQVNDDARALSALPVTRESLGLPEQGFVFCCLNSSYKITAAEFAIWMRLLGRVENSVLWLLDDNRWATANLRREAKARGIDPERLVFAGRVPMDRHLARQRCADLFLDTFAVNAHTTASDALWAGLPVLTRLGESFAARVAGSLLHAIGLPELATDSAASYEALAFELATDRTRLASLRARLAANGAATPLFDTRLFTHDFEQAVEALAASRAP